MTEERQLTELEELESIYCDMHKDVYGVKARWYKAESVEQARADLDRLSKELEVQMAHDKECQRLAIQAFEELAASCGAPMIWPRAIQVNDGPMRSNLRFTDMIDIAKGEFEAMNIVPAANLNGSPPDRAGTETVQKLAEMGLLDEQGLMIWPPPAP